ncbi:hypothetical protein [Zongyangia hominis]|uniref:HEAT repeat domain-containing protein n=1 Tax=Zongyangia hominis TaxID=2763677 RepID=A0A926I626_9FIRM|nr:hypothetical protein [Zongyangia hominis]MBC8569564.1 hypothetical protein [Zongyangia hominis]
MIFRTEVVCYLYIAVCVCMLVFNCLLILYRRYENRSLQKYINQISALVDSQLECLSYSDEMHQEIQQRLGKRLRRIHFLRAFHSVITEKREEEPALVERYLLKSRPMFSDLVASYRKEEDIKQAYFAFVMADFSVCRWVHEDPIIDFMMELIVDKSAYCRENALKALYRFGDADNVLLALRLIDENNVFHHEKLITDGLLSFAGDRQELAALLWKHFHEFHLELQIPFLNYIRAVSSDFREPFYEMLANERTDKELKIALIRYFWRHPYPPVAEVLAGFLEREDSRDWEIAAIAATAIRAYPGEQTILVLRKALLSANWYVRYNAADSLKSLDADFNMLASVFNGQDRYAREMLLFHEQQHEIKEQAQKEAELV